MVFGVEVLDCWGGGCFGGVFMWNWKRMCVVGVRMRADLFGSGCIWVLIYAVGREFSVLVLDFGN